MQCAHALCFLRDSERKTFDFLRFPVIFTTLWAFEMLDWDHMLCLQLWYIYSGLCMYLKSICAYARVYKWITLFSQGQMPHFLTHYSEVLLLWHGVSLHVTVAYLLCSMHLPAKLEECIEFVVPYMLDICGMTFYMCYFIFKFPRRFNHWISLLSPLLPNKIH